MTIIDDLLAVQTSDLIRAIDLAGVFSNGLLGGAMARAARLDAVGFVALAIISGMGGGMIRDVLLQRGTVVALTDEWYLIVALVAAAIAFFVKTDGPLWDKLFPWVDALALGTWAATGTLKALTFGLDWIPSVLLGTITAVGGGFLRDVILNQVPSILNRNYLYATCGAVGATVMVAMYEIGWWTTGPLIATVVGGGLTLIARWQNWMLPVGYEWSGLRQETERYTRAIVRRGRLLKDTASRIAPIRWTPEPGAAAPYMDDQNPAHSHRGPRLRRRRPTGTEVGSLPVTTDTGRLRAVRSSGSAGAAAPTTTGSLPRIMRSGRRSGVPGRSGPAAGPDRIDGSGRAGGSHRAGGPDPPRASGG